MTPEQAFEMWLRHRTAPAPEFTPPTPKRIVEMRNSEHHVSGWCVDRLCRVQLLHPQHVVRP